MSTVVMSKFSRRGDLELPQLIGPDLARYRCRRSSPHNCLQMLELFANYYYVPSALRCKCPQLHKYPEEQQRNFRYHRQADETLTSMLVS